MSKIEYSQGVCCDGAAILQDGVMMTVDHVVGTLNALTAELEQLRQERDGLRDLIIKTMNSYVREMEGYSYFGSNPGIDDDDIEEIADEIIAAMTKEQGDGA